MFSPRLRALLNTEWSIGHLRKDSQLRRITNLICDRSKKSKFHIDYKVHLATNLLFLIFATLPCSITPGKLHSVAAEVVCIYSKILCKGEGGQKC